MTYFPTILPKPHFGLIGHRGAAGLAPENTLYSFRLASQLGLNWIEFDARLTKDDEWIILHDETLERTTSGEGLVSDLLWKDMRGLDAGLWFNPPINDLRIPTLLETIECAHDVGLNINIEIKGSSKDRDRYIDLLVKFMSKYHTHPFASPLISSFDLEFLKGFKKALPPQRIGYLVERFTPETIDIAKEFDFTAIHCSIQHIQEENLADAFSHHLPVLLYTGNDRAEALHWLDKGVTGIFTDRPDLLHPNVLQTYQSLQQALT